MKKVFTKIAGLSVGLALAIGVGVAVGSRSAKVAKATDVLYYQATFDSADTEASVSAYDVTWSTTHDSFEWSVSNFNNNKNGWDGYVKCGRKNVASVASISTAAAVVDKVTKVSITIDALTASKINSITLYKGSSDSSITTSLGTFTKGTGTKEVTISSSDQETNQFYKIEFDCASGSSNGLLTLSNVSLYHDVSAVSPTSISCNPQSVSVASKLSLADAVAFAPAGTTEKGLSFALKSGAEYVELAESGVITGKKGGSAVVTVTPDDTSAGASAIDVAITVNSIAAPALTIGEQYVIYAVDSENSYTGELSGVENNAGTSAAMSGEVPACSYVLTAEKGCFENTVAFSDGSNYLSLNSAANNLNTSNDSTPTTKSSWIVSEVEDVTHIYNVEYQNREIQFNFNKTGNAPKFACYAGGQTAISLYHYSEKELEDFTIESEVSVYLSGTRQIVVDYDPDDASDKDLTWTSANEGIATVSNTGVVTGVAVGEVIITASKTIGGNPVEKTCTVTVLNNVASHHGTSADPFSVEDAVQVANGIFTKDPDGNPISLENSYYVEGIITMCNARTRNQLTLLIGDDASQISVALGAFQVYHAASVYGVALSNAYAADNDIKIDFNKENYVKVYSTLALVGGTPRTTENVADVVYCDYIEARKYAEVFNAAFEAEGVCDSDGKNTDVENLASVWSGQSSNYSKLDDHSKAILAGAEGKTTSGATAVEKCAAKYDYIGGKYQTQLGAEYDFMGRNPTAPSSGAINWSENSLADSNTMIIVITIAAVSALAFTTLLVFKKKKQK